jgi:hypothetical protein
MGKVSGQDVQQTEESGHRHAVNVVVVVLFASCWPLKKEEVPLHCNGRRRSDCQSVAVAVAGAAAWLCQAWLCAATMAHFYSPCLTRPSRWATVGHSDQRGHVTSVGHRATVATTIS